VDNDAIFPFRVTAGSVGYDLTAIGYKKVDHGVYLLKTGVEFDAPPGFFAILTARSSLYKHNLMPINGIGVIDEDYKGELMFPVRIIDVPDRLVENASRRSEMIDALLPLRFGQIVFMRKEVFHAPHRGNERGSGGFGSTG
jgi:dUTPase